MVEQNALADRAAGSGSQPAAAPAEKPPAAAAKPDPSRTAASPAPPDASAQKAPAKPDTAASEKADEKPGSVLEEKRRLSQSIIWALQRGFYAAKGPAAWKMGGVPFFITSNAFIAKAYARVVVGLLRDLASGATASLDRTAPIHVVELAAGSGQFSYLCMQRLLALVRSVPALQGLRIRYVMTDFAETNVKAWRARDRLRPLIDEGVLDFAVFDLENDREMTLAVSGERLAAGAVANPIVAIANYAFDTTLQDVFWVKQGVLHEGLVTTVSSRQEPPGSRDPEMLGRLSQRWEQAPVDGRYYDDPLVDGVLGSYRDHVGDTAFLLPVGALRCVRHLLDISGGRLFLLSGDKGFSRVEELLRRSEPMLALHGGSFSYMVNYHAMELYFRQAGGTAIHNTQRDTRLRTSAFYAGLPGPLAETRLAFAEALDGFGASDYHTLIQHLRKEMPAPPFDVWLSLMRLSDWDPETVVAFREFLVKQVPNAPDTTKLEVRLALQRSWQSYYPLHRDVAFEFTRLALAMKEPQDALQYGEASLLHFGEHHLTLLSLAAAHTLRGDDAKALECAERALALKPDSVTARDLKIRLQARLAGR